MDQFLLFASEQWILFSVLGCLCVGLIAYETRGADKIISTMMLTQSINRDDTLLIDVRPVEEFKQGHIARARNVPYALLNSQIDSLRKWQDKPVVIVCAHGLDSARAMRLLMGTGFINVMRLRGGLDEWRKENLPLLS